MTVGLKLWQLNFFVKMQMCHKWNEVVYKTTRKWIMHVKYEVCLYVCEKYYFICLLEEKTENTFYDLKYSSILFTVCRRHQISSTSGLIQYRCLAALTVSSGDQNYMPQSVFFSVWDSLKSHWDKSVDSGRYPNNSHPYQLSCSHQVIFILHDSRG